MARTNLSIRLHGTNLEGSDYPLSGSPRRLLQEEFQKGACRFSSRRTNTDQVIDMKRLSISTKPRLLARWKERQLDASIDGAETLSLMTATANVSAALQLLTLRLSSLQPPSTQPADFDYPFPSLSHASTIQSDSGFQISKIDIDGNETTSSSSDDKFV